MIFRCAWVVLTLLAVLALGATAWAEDKKPTLGPSREKVLECAKNMAKRTQTLIALAELVDELTKTKGNLTLKSAGRTPVAEKTFFAVEFLVPEVEFEDFVTNTVFGWEVPGRKITVKIWLDCYVECRVDVANIKIACHEEYDDTILVIVPKLELIGRVPKNREYRYEVDYGNLRAKWIDSPEARSVREEMVTKASRKAADEFGRSKTMTEFRRGFKRALRAFLKPLLPKGRRIEVMFEEE